MISTSRGERQNLTECMGMRRFIRLTNGFSKKVENRLHILSLWFLHDNFVRMHKTLEAAPAMVAGVTNTLHELTSLVGIIDAAVPAPKPRGPYRKRQFKLRHYPLSERDYPGAPAVLCGANGQADCAAGDGMSENEA
jgi:hypothetical protein